MYTHKKISLGKSIETEGRLVVARGWGGLLGGGVRKVRRNGE